MNPSKKLPREKNRELNKISPSREQLEKRLLAYTLAGAGMAALQPAATAEIVYTPKDFRFEGCNSSHPIDLNNDGLNDFAITIDGYPGPYFSSFMLVQGSESPGAGVIGLNSRGAGALRAKFPIGPTSPTPFINVDSQPLLMESATGLFGSSKGLWLRVNRRYLGLRRDSLWMGSTLRRDEAHLR